MKQEASHSGLVRTLGKRVRGNPPRVRISPPPPIATFAVLGKDCLAASPLGIRALRLAQSHKIPRRAKRKGNGFVQKFGVRSDFLNKPLHFLVVFGRSQIFGFFRV